MSVASILKEVGLEIGKPVTYKGKSAKIKQLIADPVTFDHTDHRADENMTKEKIKGVRVVIRMDERDENDNHIDKHVDVDDIKY